MKNGTGTLFLANTVPFENTGATVINAGALQIGDSVTPGLGNPSSANITTNSRLVFDRPDDFVLGSKIDGSGDLVKNGTGKVTLNLLPASTGRIIVNAGTFRFVSGGVVSNVISGAGNVETAGGTLDLSASNTYTGLTTVSAGVLRLSNPGGNAVSGDVLITGSGTLSQTFSEQIPDTAKLTFTGTSADSMPATAFTETVGDVLVAGDPAGQLIMRNGFTVLGTATDQTGHIAVASLHTGNVNKLVMSGGDIADRGQAAGPPFSISARAESRSVGASWR